MASVVYVIFTFASFFACSTCQEEVTQLPELPEGWRSSTEHHGFKPMFKGSKEIELLAKRFVMVNVHEKDEEMPVYNPNPPVGPYTPDGEYTPRFLFFDSNGDRQDDIINEYGNRKFKYFYFRLDALELSMKTLLDSTMMGRRVRDEL